MYCKIFNLIKIDFRGGLEGDEYRPVPAVCIDTYYGSRVATITPELLSALTPGSWVEKYLKEEVAAC